MNNQKPNFDDNDNSIKTEEYGPLPALDYRFFEYMQEGVMVYIPVRDESEIIDLTLTYANLAAYRQLKSLKKEIIGKNITEIYGYKSSQELKVANKVISSGRGAKYAVYLDSVDKYLSITAFAPNESLYITLATDITKRKKAEEEIHAVNQELLDIIEFLPDATFVIDKDKKVIAWNKALEEMTGVSKEKIIGKNDYVYSIPFYGHKRPIIIDLIFLDEKEIESKYSYVKRDGSTLFAEVFVNNLYGGKGAYVFVKASPLYDNEGNIHGSIETVRDITEQKKSEIELLESEEKFRSTIEQSIDGIVIIDEKGIIIEWNKGMERITGHQREEELGKLIWESQYELLPNEEKDSKIYDYIQGTVQQFLQTGSAEWIKKHLDRRIQRPDGEIKYIQSVTYPIKTGKGIMLGNITRDITNERKLKKN